MTGFSDRRCAACGADLYGRVAYPFFDGRFDVLSCPNSHCLSVLYNRYVGSDSGLTHEGRDRVTSQIHMYRCDAVRERIW